MNNTFRIILLGIFVAQSLVLYIIEGFIPIPFIAPGAKLGLANLITIIALYSLPRKKRCLFYRPITNYFIRSFCGWNKHLII